jgi:hypothetical protein
MHTIPAFLIGWIHKAVYLVPQTRIEVYQLLPAEMTVWILSEKVAEIEEWLYGYMASRKRKETLGCVHVRCTSFCTTCVSKRCYEVHSNLERKTDSI